MENWSKMRFDLSFRDFEFSTYLNESCFLTDFDSGYDKNKSRFGFLSNFGVDMYIAKNVPRRFFCVFRVVFAQNCVFYGASKTCFSDVNAV